MTVEPRQRDVWFARLEPVQGGEQGGSRPVVLLSRPIATTGQPVVLCVPLTRTDRGTHLHVRIDPPEGELHKHQLRDARDDARNLHRAPR